MDAREGPPLFGSWLSETGKLQAESYGKDVEAIPFDGGQKGDFVQAQFGYTVRELGEMMEEFPGTKDWVTDRTVINRSAFIDEAVDALHFLGNILKSLGCTDEELSARYSRKMQINRERMASKTYDGVSDKCKMPGCRRELKPIGYNPVTRYCPAHPYLGPQ